MWSRLLPSAAPSLAPGFPIPLRRHAVDDNAYTAALLVGCLIGVGLAWGVILGEGGRGRILGAMAGLDTSVSQVEASEPQLPVPGSTADNGILGRPSRPQQYDACHVAGNYGPIGGNSEGRGASRRQACGRAPTRASGAGRREDPGRASAARGGSVRGGTGDRLRRQQQLSGAGRNLGAAWAGLGTAGWRPYRLALQAAVSDDGVKGAKPKEAERYNRWLAERRLDRVATWLREHAELELAIEPGFIEHDPSRRVTLSARQVP